MHHEALTWLMFTCHTLSKPVASRSHENVQHNKVRHQRQVCRCSARVTGSMVLHGVQVKALMLAQRALLYGGDELAMARLRLRVQLEGEEMLGREQTFVLHPAEVPVRNKACLAIAAVFVCSDAPAGHHRSIWAWCILVWARCTACSWPSCSAIKSLSSVPEHCTSRQTLPGVPYAACEPGPLHAC